MGCCYMINMTVYVHAQNSRYEQRAPHPALAPPFLGVRAVERSRDYSCRRTCLLKGEGGTSITYNTSHFGEIKLTCHVKHPPL